jgi:hypothetical protein
MILFPQTVRMIEVVEILAGMTGRQPVWKGMDVFNHQEALDVQLQDLGFQYCCKVAYAG